jgi:hypothetical protein
VVTCLPLDAKLASSNSAEDDGIFKGDKNLSRDFLRKGSKAIIDLRHVKKSFVYERDTSKAKFSDFFAMFHMLRY